MEAAETMTERPSREKDLETAVVDLSPTSEDEIEEASPAGQDLISAPLIWAIRLLVFLAYKACLMMRYTYMLLHVVTHTTWPLWRSLRLPSGGAVQSFPVVQSTGVQRSSLDGTEQGDATEHDDATQDAILDDRPPEYTAISRGISHEQESADQSGPPIEAWIATVVFCLMALRFLIGGDDRAYISDSLEGPLRILLVPAMCVASCLLCFVFVIGVMGTKPGKSNRSDDQQLKHKATA